MSRTTRRRFLQTGAASLALPIRFARAAKSGGLMRMGKAHGQTVDSLDPGTHENGFTIAMTHGYNNYMTEAAADGALVGQLAESWEASADVATWIFKLRTGVVYHNGREVTAEDVAASIDHHRGEESTSAAKPIVAPITDIKADRTRPARNRTAPAGDTPSLWIGLSRRSTAPRGGQRGLCTRCGTPLTCEGERLPGETHFGVSTFDDLQVPMQRRQTENRRRSSSVSMPAARLSRRMLRM